MGKSWIVTVLLLTILSACLSTDDGITCLIGEGGLVTETRTISGDFTAVLHQIPGILHITQGSTPSLVIEGQANIMPFLISQISNDILALTFNECLESGLNFNVFLTVTDLNAISLSGAGNIIFENDIVTNRLELFTTGLGSYDLQGSADTLEITLSGQGNVNAFDFITEHSDVVIAGTGDIEVTANRSLFVTITGQGNVFYKGMPTVVSNINGVGTVTDAN